TRAGSFEMEATSILPSLNVKTARSRRGIVPFTHLAREGRMTVTIGRRELLAALGGAAVAWPLAASAEGPTVPLNGLLTSAPPGPFARLVDAFRQGLREGGYVEGRNVTIEYRWADGQFARLPDLAAELVHRRVSLIVAAGGTVSARAAKEATTTIPILFIVGP